MYIRINFDMFNDMLNDINKIHHDFQKIKKTMDMVLEDAKNLFIIFVVGQWDI